MTSSRTGWVRPAERPFVQRATEWVERVLTRGRWQLTDFLSPREVYLLEAIARREGMVVRTDGGYDAAERRRALVLPEDWPLAREDFRIAVLAAVGMTPGFAPEHGHVLGSILGTGIERRLIGDIAVTDDKVLVAVCKEMESYLLQNWRQVGRDPVRVDVVTGSVAWPLPAYETQVITVSSLRVDAVLAQACRLSRARAQEAVAGGKVSLNFAPCSHPDEEVGPGDLLSLRGFGRVWVRDVKGVSRRDRMVIEVGVLKSRSR
ncbi:RNA-binding protein S4 [Alicyclobacillus cellulosilyticus]|uniref:RNA-binding protein S4 n=1 Tax=Alicyclobacillus cellulosilyticus TaxID=1003997 RepID=A0A917K4M8_9BACL|nr:YlmH/Sll1252 family protein [Alicyclobacillus cellulosilyticus]GGI97330.1 RNA-binding protein S4 [Alicyclobacillus cellulosilyticus]